MPCQSPVIEDVHGWLLTESWSFRCLFCPPDRNNWIANSHLDLNRIHDHLSRVHLIPFHAFFCCVHEQRDGQILWRLPDGRTCLCFTFTHDR